MNKNFSPYKIVKEALQSLRPNEQKVIADRFGIDSNRKTLSLIGKELKLSRERIRQIEKESLKRLSSSIVEKEKENVDQLIHIFTETGGISSQSRLAEKFLDEAFRDNPNEFNALNLIFYLIPNIKKIEKTKELEEGWMLSKISKDDVLKIIDEWSNHLQKRRKPETIDVLVKNNPHQSKYEVTFLSELPQVSKKLVKTESGHVGLASWPEVNPKNVRDKIYFVLKKENKPLHFTLIADKINESGFGKKKVVKATVHNELIADKRFVLVGRGIYALSEWGFKPGTVRDIIVDVLQKFPQGLSVDKIVEEVLKQRTVKKNTILINLQTKKDFKRAQKDIYTLQS